MRTALTGGVVTGLVVSVSYGMLRGWTAGGRAGAIYAVVFGIVFALINGLTLKMRTVVPVETVRWSWGRMLRGWMLSALSIAIVAGLAIRLFITNVRLPEVLASGLFYGIIVGLIGGIGSALITGEVDEKIVPNQGIRRSAFRAAIGLAFGGLGGSLVALFLAATASSQNQAADLQNQLAGLLTLGFAFALAGALRSGGLACIHHLALRFVLWRIGDAPWRYAHFLDAAAGRILLRKVGGGYTFIHRLLFEYYITRSPYRNK